MAGSDVGDPGVMGHAARLVQAIDRQQSMESEMLREIHSVSGAKIQMQIHRLLPMLHRIRPSNLSNLGNQILMTRDPP